MDARPDGHQAARSWPGDRFVTIAGHRIHYVEEGEGEPVLFIHGNPTWSFIWRNVLPAVARETGTRGIALDLLGFGRSDKPRVRYTARLHYEIVEGFIEELGLERVTLVLQDWGGPLGALFATRHPDRVKAIALMESFLWALSWEDLGSFKWTFRALRSPVGWVMIQGLNMMVRKLIPSTCPVTEETLQEYIRPFPTIGSRRAMRAFPKLIPIEGRPTDSVAFVEEIQRGLPSLTRPVLWLRASPGIVVNEKNPSSLRHLTGLSEQLPQLEVLEFGPGHHFLQEDDPARLSSLLIEWMRKNERDV